MLGGVDLEGRLSLHLTKGCGLVRFPGRQGRHPCSVRHDNRRGRYPRHAAVQSRSQPQKQERAHANERDAEPPVGNAARNACCEEVRQTFHVQALLAGEATPPSNAWKKRLTKVLKLIVNSPVLLQGYYVDLQPQSWPTLELQLPGANPTSRLTSAALAPAPRSDRKLVSRADLESFRPSGSVTSRW